ncbi:hypothetical protein BDM02DRAFT_3251214 [Thelephora ganbajun]|uniref:Uncharacterized protein n=1 Tax=Thelephora ganbajun TaxID=370292 RepID=A0ACB6ZC33_THEGA|nr:hypothetical protein BDM02DRAFT_3251214 [Thelephora ganbajun]
MADTRAPDHQRYAASNHNASPTHSWNEQLPVQGPSPGVGHPCSENHVGFVFFNSPHASYTTTILLPTDSVMGTTGSGKSTFINLVSGSNLGVSRKLGSCTNTVQVVEAFNLDGRRVVLIDTPGFDDTTQSDTDVLRTIAAFLGASYERGDKLTGVLYFHRITDLRMGGTQTRNFRMFRKLCGESALRNVVIVTNMWGGVEPGIGDAREAELMREDIFFKPVLESGARMARHENTVSSAEGIIRLLIDNQPLPLQIQRELVHECKDIVETSAGQELNRELSDQIRKHQEDICVLVEEMEQATRDKDEETRNELEIETRRMREQTWRLEEEARRLASDYWREKNEFQARLAELERARQDGYRGTEFPRYSPRWGGHYDRFPPASSYGSTSTTEQQSVNAPGLFGKDKTSVVNSARTFARNLRERWQ